MRILDWVRPLFWKRSPEAGSYTSLFNYQRTWKLAIVLLAVVALVPLLVMTAIDYNLTQQAIVSENLLRTSRVTSNTRRTVTYFLDERRAALQYTIQEVPYRNLRSPELLAEVLENLKKGIGGYVDLGLIDTTGRQVTYVGPYSLHGRDYSQQDWFVKTKAKGYYVSDVFRGFRDVPHMIVAVKRDDPRHGEYILRATLDSQRLNEIVAELDLSDKGDAFIINTDGILQTPSRYHGDILEPVNLPVPSYSESTKVLESVALEEGVRVVGYAYIQNSPFVLMVVKDRQELMKPWFDIRFELLGFLVVSVTVIILVIVGVATYMINKIFIADETRAMTLHQMEFTNRMASIGRLAAGVAHEINNPLAVINEKAGLIKDLIQYKGIGVDDKRYTALIDAVLMQVERCGAITKRLLGFARHINVSAAPVDLAEVVREVLGFLHKEAEYRDIKIDLDVMPETPSIVSDKGKLQQIILNLVNNAFQAMSDCGQLWLKIGEAEKGWVFLEVEDNGSGIPEENLKKIFDPFFSTKLKTGGTGLGLSITYGLVQELGGKLKVKSEVGRGTTFTILFPLEPSKELLEGRRRECTTR